MRTLKIKMIIDSSLLKGKYTSLRILRTVINFSALAAMPALAYSGIVMLRHVFSFLPINGGMATARVMHLAGSYWGLVWYPGVKHR